jgi:hypothetical protein
VEAAYSSFLHRRRDRHEPESDFLKAYRLSSKRFAAGWAPMLCYRRYYANNIEYWLSHFPREQFRFYLTDDLKSPTVMLRDLFHFLGVEENFQPTLARKNTAYTIRSHTFGQLLVNDLHQPPVTKLLKRFIPSKLRHPLRSSFQKWNKTAAPRLDPQIRNELTNELREEIFHLQNLIDRDLSRWLEEI